MVATASRMSAGKSLTSVPDPVEGQVERLKEDESYPLEEPGDGHEDEHGRQGADGAAFDEDFLEDQEEDDRAACDDGCRPLAQRDEGCRSPRHHPHSQS